MGFLTHYFFQSLLFFFIGLLGFVSDIVVMRIFGGRVKKLTAVLISSVLLLSGCSYVDTEVTVNNSGNIEGFTVAAEFDKEMFNRFLFDGYIYTPPDDSFFEDNPTINPDMGEGLIKFAVFFQEMFVDAFYVESFIPEGVAVNYLRGLCEYSDDMFFFKVDCNVDVPFMVSLPLMGSFFNGSTVFDETSGRVEHSGLLNNFISLPLEAYTVRGSFDLVIVFPEDVVSVSGEGVSSSGNTVMVDVLDYNRAVFEGADGTLVFTVGWVEMVPFWQTVWFRWVMFGVSVFFISSTILKIFKRRKVETI